MAAFNPAGDTIGTTFDGTDYTSTTSDTPTTSFLEGIAYGQKRWVAVGAASVTGTSSDAVNWRMQAPSVGYLRSVIFFNNQFLAVGDNGTIRTSFDGGTWNPRASGTNQLLTSVAGNQTAAVAVGFGGSILRSVAARSAPAIAVQPTDITEAVGGNVAFSVSARGSEPLSYQWLKGGLPIIGAVSDTLFLPTITNASAGNYSCVITNPVSQITSSNANLSVVPSYPQNQAVDANFSADPLVKGANFAAIQSDGKILVTQVPLFLNQNQAQSGLARLSAAGTLDTTFKPGRIDGVTHATVQTDGRIVISGSFSNVNGVSRPYLARLNSDGSLDSAFNAAHNGSHSGAVTVAPDGKILFKRANSFSDITRLLADGSLDASWLYAPVTVGSNYGTDAKGNVYAFDVQPDGKVIVLFLASTSTDQDGSRVRSFVRRLNLDGTLDATFAGSFNTIGQGFGGNSSAVIVKVLTDGRIMVSDTSSIRRLTPTGALDSTYRVQSGSPSIVAFGSDGRSWVGGMFSGWGGSPNNQLLRLNADGSQDETYSSGAGIQWRMWGRGTGYYLAPIPPSSIIPLQNGSALIGGSFTVVDTTETNGLIKTTVQSTNGANRPIIVAVDSAYREVPVGTSYSTAISASGSPPLSGGGTLSAVAQTSGPVKYTVRNGIGSSAEQWGYVRVIPSAPEFTDALKVTQPNPGSVVTLSVMVRGSNPMTYRFFKDGKILSSPPGESSGSFSLNPRSVADSGSYVVVVENSLGSITSAPLILSFSVPTITVQPIPQITSVGQTVTLAVAASGYPAPAFVWKKNGVNVQSGASTTYTIPSVTAADAGNYTVDVVNSLGTVVSSVASVTVGPASFLSSLSVRSSLAANQTLILGAVIRGGNKSVLVRAAGPALNDFQLSGMEDPRLEFYTTSSAPLAANDDWPISLAPVSASVGAFPS